MAREFDLSKKDENEQGKYDNTNVTTIMHLLSQIPKTAVLEYALFTTYDGMDFRTLENILMSLPRGNRFVSKGSYDIFCGSKSGFKGTENSFLTELMLSHVHRVTMKGAFHPKIYCVQYKNDDAKEIMLVISSKNITENAFLDAYVCLKGIKGDKPCNGSKFKDVLDGFKLKPKEDKVWQSFIKSLEEYCFKLWDSDKDTHMPKEITFLKPSKPLVDELRCKKNLCNGSKLLVVSPFVSECLLNNNIVLFSSEDELKRINDLRDAEAFYWCEKVQSIGKKDDDKNNEVEKYPSSLHAKIYVKRNAVGDSEIYIGSANYTRAAFSSDNAEILVKIVYEGGDKYTEILNTFMDEVRSVGVWNKWIPTEKENGGGKQDRICKAVYDELANIKAKIHGERIQYKIGEKYDGKSVEVGNKKVDIESITPTRMEDLTRNVEIAFTVTTSEQKVDGSMVLDLLDLFEDNEDDKKKIDELLENKIKRDLHERKRSMITKGKTIKAVKKNAEDDSDKNNNNQGRKKATYREGIGNGLFETIKRKALTDRKSVKKYIDYLDRTIVSIEEEDQIWTEEENVMIELGRKLGEKDGEGNT